MTATTGTTGTIDLAAVKAKQQRTWSSGDFSVVASRIVLVSEQLAESADLRAGWNVLDVACGNGNATLAAARSGTHAVGVDYVPELLVDARGRAVAEGLDVAFVEGDAENLPVRTASVDATLSVFGAMFAPDHRRAADEIVRVTRAGGTVGLASWTPEGFIGEMFRTVGRHVPPPAGLASPLLWGTEVHLRELFGEAAAELHSVERTCVWRYRSAEDMVAFFRRWYGPTFMAFGALDESGQDALGADLTALVRSWDRNRDDGSIAVPATYLETVLRLH